MSLPLIIVGGKAGVGKDTAAGIIGRKYGAVLIAQADPLKRLALWAMHFSQEQLWGPSEMRNAPDNDKERILDSWQNSKESKEAWLDDIGMYHPRFADKLQDWFNQYVATPLLKQGCITPRHVLQTLGTEFGRANRPDVWVSYAQDRAIYALANNQKYDREAGLSPKAVNEPVTGMAVITDGRFPNEIIATKRNGGFAFKITGPGETSLGGVAAQHASETEMDKIPGYWYDEIIYNAKDGIANLEGKVDAALYNQKILRDR